MENLSQPIPEGRKSGKKIILVILAVLVLSAVAYFLAGGQLFKGQIDLQDEKTKADAQMSQISATVFVKDKSFWPLQEGKETAFEVTQSTSNSALFWTDPEAGEFKILHAKAKASPQIESPEPKTYIFENAYSYIINSSGNKEEIHEYCVDFGDDSPEECNTDGANITHTYKEAGNYTAHYKIKNQEGYLDDEAIRLTIVEAEEAKVFEYIPIEALSIPAADFTCAVETVPHEGGFYYSINFQDASTGMGDDDRVQIIFEDDSTPTVTTVQGVGAVLSRTSNRKGKITYVVTRSGEDYRKEGVVDEKCKVISPIQVPPIPAADFTCAVETVPQEVGFYYSINFQDASTGMGQEDRVQIIFEGDGTPTVTTVQGVGAVLSRTSNRKAQITYLVTHSGEDYRKEGVVDEKCKVIPAVPVEGEGAAKQPPADNKDNLLAPAAPLGLSLINSILNISIIGADAEKAYNYAVADPGASVFFTSTCGAKGKSLKIKTFEPAKGEVDAVKLIEAGTPNANLNILEGENCEQPEVKTEPEPEVKTEPEPEVKTEPEPEVKTEPEPEAKTEPKTEPKPVSKDTIIAKPKPKEIASTQKFVPLDCYQKKPYETYSDVPKTHYYEEFIDEFSTNNAITGDGKFEPIIQGYQDDDGSKVFLPDRNISRAEAWKVITRAGCLHEWAKENKDNFKGQGASQFKDLSKSFWGYNEIDALAKAEIIQGYLSGAIGPDNMITRAEYVKTILKVFQMQTGKECSDEVIASVPQFKDADKSEWYVKYAPCAKYYKIWLGSTGNLARPNDFITRGEAMTILSNFVKAKGGIVER